MYCKNILKTYKSYCRSFSKFLWCPFTEGYPFWQNSNLNKPFTILQETSNFSPAAKAKSSHPEGIKTTKNSMFMPPHAQVVPSDNKITRHHLCPIPDQKQRHVFCSVYSVLGWTTRTGLAKWWPPLFCSSVTSLQEFKHCGSNLN